MSERAGLTASHGVIAVTREGRAALPRELAVTDPDYLIEYGQEAVRYYPPYCAKRDGRWSVWEAWRVERGPNVGACEYRWRWMRWWHPADLVLFVKDRRKARRMFGAWR